MEKPLPASQPKPNQDHEDKELMEHVALEGIHAIHSKKPKEFMDAMHLIIPHVMRAMKDEGDRDV